MGQLRYQRMLARRVAEGAGTVPFEVNPVQARGENIFWRRRDKDDLPDRDLVRVHFQLWTKYQIDIMNIDLRHGEERHYGFVNPVALTQTLVIDGIEMEMDGSSRMVQRHRTEAGSVADIRLQREFDSEVFDDYGPLSIRIEMLGPRGGGFRCLTIKGRLGNLGTLDEVELHFGPTQARKPSAGEVLAS